MKKLLALLLLTGLILPLMTACGKPSPAGQNSEDSEPGDETSQEVSYNEEELAAQLLAAKIDGIYTGELPEKYEYVNIINGNSYTINLESYKNYPDDGKKLTDNDDALPADGDKWVGFLGKNDIEIIVDLGGLKTNLGGFSINNLYDSSSGKGVTKTAEFWVSADGVEYIKAATSFKYPSVIGTSQVYKHAAYTQFTFDAAFVKVVLTGFVSQWTLVDGIKVFTVGQDSSSDNQEYYINEPLPENITAEYWDETDEDYNTRKNLIFGLGQRVYSGISLKSAHKTDYYNTPAASKVLTNGKFGDTNYLNPAYFHITQGATRSIIYDLGKISEVTKAAVGIFILTDYGIVFPDGLSVLISENAVDWQTVLTKDSTDFPYLSYSRTTLSYDFDSPYKARFVKFRFTVSALIWLDELEVWGTKAISSSAKTIVPDEKEEELGYPSPDLLDGSENILLAYNYKTENVSAGRTTKTEYLPYVGYYNTDGELQDFFFDSYLYLPCSTVLPSGGKLFTGQEKYSIKSDWLDYENDLFFENVNVNALEAAVEEVKTKLNQPDYQVNVFLSVFNPDIRCKNFGDVDGDGITENMSILADRKKVVKWWIDRQIERYTERGFENQKLVGFYWYDESLSLSEPLYKQTILFATDYIHSLGYKAVWIPYLNSPGFTQWKAMGFDVANMQPNYMFNEDYTEEVVYSNARTTKTLGMGVEIEISGKAISSVEYHDRYLVYLKAGVEMGYMNAIKMYYQDAGPGVYYAAYNSSDPYVRSLYDVTYLYAKRLLTNSGFKVAKTEFTVKKNETLKDKLIGTNGEELGAAVKIAAKYGAVAADKDGSFIYIPMADFVGEDSFILSVSYGFYTEIVEFTVKITK